MPADSIKNAIIIGRLRARSPLALEDARFLRQHTRKPIKVTLPGPYLLVRSSWVDSLARRAYSSREEWADDVAAASARPDQELEFAVALINRVDSGVDRTVTALHVCRGNWSREEAVLLSGSYDGLIPYLARLHVRQFVLEYATRRAGDPGLLAELPPGSASARVEPRIGARTHPPES